MKKTISEQHPEKYASKLTRYSSVFLPEKQIKKLKKYVQWPKSRKKLHRCFQKHSVDNSNFEIYSPIMNPFNLVNRTCLSCLHVILKGNRTKTIVKLCSPLFMAW